ncbi:S-layer homology domain-containing protein [Petroclostridium sp. X23]|uniref:S-layer homology domain-containing protein n=1 Tax=Petroclostridium sp. X23 TaxID=3045146 RepID=UPI0024AE6498|nr:S-layer homology domain-containing protein [Petroclostridium sp. X23]WHH57318.1 S-layer homology domain-containing protein [Petroclostridium sp. X23]
MVVHMKGVAKLLIVLLVSFTIFNASIADAFVVADPMVVGPITEVSKIGSYDLAKIRIDEKLLGNFCNGDVVILTLPSGVEFDGGPVVTFAGSGADDFDSAIVTKVSSRIYHINIKIPDIRTNTAVMNFTIPVNVTSLGSAEICVNIAAPGTAIREGSFVVGRFVSDFGDIELSPLQKVMVQGLSLSAQNRDLFATEILGPLKTVYSEVYVTPQLVDYGCYILGSVSTSDMEKALKAYVPYSTVKKRIIEAAIKEGLPVSLNNTTGFPNIADAINNEVTGDPTNDIGLRLVVKMLSTVTSITGPIAFNDANDTSKIDFKLEGYETVKSTVSSLIDSVETLKAGISTYEGDTNFDKLLMYAEQLVNSQPSEVAAFKTFLKSNGDIFEGTVEAPDDDDDNDGNTEAPGNTGGGTPTSEGTQVGDADEFIKDGSKQLEKVISVQAPDRNAKEQAKKAIEDAVKEAAKINVNSKDVKVQGTTAALEVKADTLKAAVANAVKVAQQLTKQAKDAGVDVMVQRIVTIEVPRAEGVKEVETKFPADILSTAKTSGIDRIAVDTGIATVAIASDALKDSIVSGAEKIELSVAAVDKTQLSAEIAEKVGSQPVYDFNLSVDGNKISKFEGENPIEISVDYTLAAGEDPDKIVIYYINDNGELEAVKNCRYDPDTGKVTFKTNHFSKYTVKESDVTFKDVSTVPWAKTSIEALAGRGIIGGIGEDKFDPDSNITREQFAKMIVEAFDLMDEAATTTLSDVDKNAWYAKHIASAQKSGVINGIGDSKFGVGSKISRQDMAVMAYRAALKANARLETTNAKEEFADEESIDSYAVEAVYAMLQANIINGVGSNTFRPKDYTTRAAAAKVIYLLYKTLP